MLAMKPQMVNICEPIVQSHCTMCVLVFFFYSRPYLVTTCNITVSGREEKYVLSSS